MLRSVRDEQQDLQDETCAQLLVVPDSSAFYLHEAVKGVHHKSRHAFHAYVSSSNAVYARGLHACITFCNKRDADL